MEKQNKKTPTNSERVVGFNEKQEITAKRISVVNYNTEIRNKLLMRNIGKYDQYDEELVIPIGTLVDVYSGENNKALIIGEGGLFAYTNNNKTEYGKYITNHYKRDLDELETYELINPSPKTMEKWGGKYVNYIDYVYNAYGKQEEFYISVNEALAKTDIKYALHRDKVGVVRDINVAASLGGVVITNNNNFSGTDTPIGLIGNKAYAKSLELAGQFNSYRRSPSLSKDTDQQFGVNLKNLSILTELYTNKGPLFQKKENKWVYMGGTESKLTATTYDDLSELSKFIYLNNIEKKERASSTRKSRTDIKPNMNGMSIDNISSIFNSGLGTYYKNIYSFYSGDTAVILTDVAPSGSSYVAKDFSSEPNSLLSKTNELFKQSKIKSLIAKFNSYEDNENSLIQTGVNPVFGLSKGRNLLKKGVASGDPDPYCRTWTFHKQYNQFKDLIRPVKGENGEILNIEELQRSYVGYTRREGGHTRLNKLSVMNSNVGMVNITPTYGKAKEVKRTMFSLENLAWKDNTNTLDAEQIGPLGGRIMWFPPYGIEFNENVNVSWENNVFIGRGEPIYTYGNTERSGNLSFTLLIDHPSILNYITKEDDEENRQDILRFFAGCGNLEVNDETDFTETIITSTQPETPSQDPIPVPDETENLIVSIYFPNNYSGIDDLSGAVGVDPMTYLFCGWGTQSYQETKYVNKVGAYGSTIPLPKGALNEAEFLTNGYIYYPKNNGYEMKENGISWDKPNLNDVHGEHDNLREGNNEDEWKYQWGPNVKVGEEQSSPFCNQIKWVANSKIERGFDKDELKQYSFRVDKSTIEQNIIKDSTTDMKSFRFNSHGDEDKIEEDEKNEKKTFTFSELYTIVANTPKIYEYVQDVDNGFIMGKYNTEEHLKLLRDYLRNNTQRRIKKITIYGYASKAGHDNLNDELSRNRAKVIKEWLVDGLNLNPNIITFEGKGIDNTRPSETTKSPINNSDPKKSRRVDVEITIENGGITNFAPETPRVKVSPVEIETKQVKIKRVKSSRYNREHEFFEQLDQTVPLYRTKINEKIKYFDPAYHSITPEGFNSRLTFLQQCTRQGNTRGVSDGVFSATAGNLSFGRPPICVLRVGDFYNTKIIIEGVNISYEQWDLNPEGIGVQPMLAKVSLAFKFIGGSELGGPIAQLQNAVSFNYYANTSVYDDRSTIVDYKENFTPNYKGYGEQNKIK